MMLSNSTTPTIRLSLPGMICTAMLLLVMVATARSQDSPCNQGRAVWPRVDPRYDWLICVPEIGRQRGVIGQCQWNVSEGYGGGVAPLGRLTPNGPYGWIVTHKRCDTTPSFQELLLYRSAGGQLPDGKDYERIGPREILSDVRFLAAGDWDNSGTSDLCCYIQIYGDSSAGPNPRGYEYGYVVVFWSDSLGHYSIDDTTQLACDADRWGGVAAALGTDRDNDGIDDLFLVSASYGFSNGGIVSQAGGRIYRGHDHKQWGHDGVSRAADFTWWHAPNLYSFIKEIDQDGDGHKDVAWFGDNNGYQTVSVWYGDGKPGIPDTSAVEAVDLTITNGEGANLIDISNDGIPELVVHCGSLEQLAIFVGIKGQRISEQFGPGLERLDTNRPPERWWTKPFARIWLPNRINDAWPQSTWNIIYDLGDANNDGYRDIWIRAQPFLLCYSSGPALDSLIDAMIDISPGPGIYAAQNLGDILGTGHPVFGIGTGDAVIYARPDNQVPARSSNPRRWPDGTLGPRLGAEDDKGIAAPAARLDVIPNPSSGDVELRWDCDVENGTLIISDAAGREVLRVPIDRAARSYMVPCTRLVPGLYFALLRDPHAAATARMILR